MDEEFFNFPEDLESALVENGLVDDLFYLYDYEQRKIFLIDEISHDSIVSVVRNILQFNKEDKEIPIEDRKPILLYISSVGGETDAGYELIDVIEASKTPVYTINFGFQYSMAFLVGLAGHKRYATKNAKFLMHDGSSLIYDSGAKAQDMMRFQSRVEQRTKEYVISKSKITSAEYDDKFRVEWYLFADEAKECGFTDYIIGEDCDLDEII